MMGLALQKNEGILNAVQSRVGYAPLHRIFLQDDTLPHIMTMLLGRTVGQYPANICCATLFQHDLH